MGYSSTFYNYYCFRVSRPVPGACRNETDANSSRFSDSRRPNRKREKGALFGPEKKREESVKYNCVVLKTK